MNPEVHRAQNVVGGRRVGLTVRRDDLVERLVRQRISVAGDRQRQIVGDQYDDARRTDQQHDAPARLQVVSSRRSGTAGSSVGGAPHHGIAECGQRDGDPDGRGVRGYREIRVNQTEPS